MSRNVTVGLDGSPESRAAAEWAAREGKLRGLPVKLLQVWEPLPVPMAQAPLLGAETQARWREPDETGAPLAADWGGISQEEVAGLRLRHPGVDVTLEQVSGTPTEVLTAAGKDAELLVLGSRGLGGLGGFLLGSVGQAVTARTEVPVIMVRAGEQAAEEHETDPVGIPSAATPYRPVVLGLDTYGPDDAVITFAFEEAARRATTLHVVHGWSLPGYYAYALSTDPELGPQLQRQDTAALTEALRPWRTKYPAVETVEESCLGSPARHLVDAARKASLIVVGRRIRRSPIGSHIGPVTHAVLHHSTAPVAVVAHG
ncbi:universal stress protein [Streptomyces sp. NPDC048484]|uniref:universal stress protein n=1 Tax=Streptomyces sp. NPDC048484 TaxID=3155146 RepID=UPI0034330707